MRYIIIGLIILVIIGFIMEYIYAIVALAILIAAILFVHWLYAKINYPIWPIEATIVFLIIFNLIYMVRYLRWKSKYMKVLKESLYQAEEINCIKDNGIETMVSEGILSAMESMGMGTDAEIFENMDWDITDELSERIAKLRNWLQQYEIRETKVEQIDQALCEFSSKKVFREQLKKLVGAGKIVINTELNGQEKKTKSWDNMLYGATEKSTDASNMLPTIHMEID